jgi:hypothetical protein
MLLTIDPRPESIPPDIAATLIKSATDVLKFTPVPMTFMSGKAIPPTAESSKPAILYVAYSIGLLAMPLAIVY